MYWCKMNWKWRMNYIASMSVILVNDIAGRICSQILPICLCNRQTHVMMDLRLLI